MKPKIWRVEDVRNHLLAVQAGMQASAPASLLKDDDGCLAAYRQGSDAAIKYLVERFGIDLDDAQPLKKPQTGELRLKTWVREDIKRNLEVAREVMHAGALLLQEQNSQLIAYYEGIDDTLYFLARSFDIEGFTRATQNGSSR
jgi:hypothetical protein